MRKWFWAPALAELRAEMVAWANLRGEYEALYRRLRMLEARAVGRSRAALAPTEDGIVDGDGDYPVSRSSETRHLDRALLRHKGF